MSDSLIHRWSRQKIQSEQDDAPALKDEWGTQVEPTPSASEHRINSRPDDGAEEKPDTIELPPIESLDEDSDYSVFMSPEVEEGLRKIALRKLFKSPIFNVVDGLNDYDEDFTNFAALGDIVTSDMKFHEERKKAEAALKQQLDESEDDSAMMETESLTRENTNRDDADAPTKEDPVDQPNVTTVNEEKWHADDKENDADQFTV